MRGRRLLLVVALVVAALGAWRIGAAEAGVAPQKVGYWMRSQQTLVSPPVGLDPRVDPLVPRYVPQPPQTPFIPAGGLYVANSADATTTTPTSNASPPEDGPTAISALTFDVGKVASATLELRVFNMTGQPPPTSPTQTQPPAPNSFIHLAACTVDAEWLSPPNGGPGRWDDRPRHGNDACVLGQWSTDGSRITFELGRERQFSEGRYDLVIVPDPAHAAEPPNTAAPSNPSDTNEVAGKANEVRNQAARTNPSFSVVFDPPRQESLTVGEADDPSPPPPDDPPSDDPPPDEPAADDVSLDEFAVAAPPGLFDVADPGTVLNGPAPVSPPRRARLRPPGTFEPAASIGDTRGSRLLAAVLLAALMAAWWWVAGQPVPKLALLGPPARKEADEPAAPPETTDGIGRFLRPRSDRPRPLL